MLMVALEAVSSVLSVVMKGYAVVGVAAASWGAGWWIGDRLVP